MGSKKYNAYAARAKALNRGSGEKVSPDDLRSIVALYDSECFYCQKSLDFEVPGSGATFDHLVPRSRGGKNTKRNLVPCCDKCNGSKDEKRIKWDSKAKKVRFTWDGVKPSEGQSSVLAHKRRNGL